MFLTLERLRDLCVIVCRLQPSLQCAVILLSMRLVRRCAPLQGPQCAAGQQSSSIHQYAFIVASRTEVSPLTTWIASFWDLR